MLALAAAILAAALAVAALLPFLPVGAWIVRLFDFPRLQLAALAAVPLALVGINAVSGGWSPAHAAIAGVALASGLWQLAQNLPFTSLWPKELPAAGADPAGRVRLAVSNLCKENDQRDAARDALAALDADVLLLIEFDDDWARTLAPLADAYPHRVNEARDHGLGMALWSRLELTHAEVRHLVTRARPSVHARLTLPGGHPTRVVGVHPTPPGLRKDETDDTDADGRHDSRIRDAELVRLAREIREDEDTDTPWIVLGDLNDVAWSHTTRLFKRLSGLKDPRVGRGLVNSYDARRKLLRYPIDHLFLSPGYAIADLGRERLPGSDHFILYADIRLDAPEGPDTEDDRSDRQEASRLADKGDRETDEPA